MNPLVVLVVDDDPTIRTMLVRLLGAHDVEVLEATDGLEALQVLEDNAVQLVITDEVMPRVTGVRLLESIRSRWPGVTRVLFTGHPEAEVVLAAINRGGVHKVLLKGSTTDLHEEIAELLEECHAARSDHDSGRPPVIHSPTAHRVVVVCDELAVRRRYDRALEGFRVQFATRREAITSATAEGHAADVVVVDISDDADPLAFIRALRAVDLDCPVVIVAPRSRLDVAHQALAYGAYRYVIHPFSAAGLGAAVREAAGLRRVARLRRGAGHAGSGAAWELSDRASLEVRFRNALDELYMAYQPIVVPSSRSILGFEALVRSREPTLPHPGAIFDAARRLNRVVELGRAIRKSAIDKAHARLNGSLLFLNLDIADIDQDDLLSPPLSSMADRIVLEVTERAALEGVADIYQRIAELRALGYRIAVDDLGAGYAGLTSFAALQPEVVKLDMSLIRGIHESPVKQRLVAGLQEACDDLLVEMVAEGVETVDELRALEVAGCEVFQGYLFARPAAEPPEVAWQ